MKIGKQIEIETINLKFLTEQLDLAEQHLKEGADDLYFRLSHFRKRVTDQDKDKYDQFFFGAKMSDLEKELDDIKNQIVLHEEKNELPVAYKKKDPWLKKIYRKIVASTHPDKFQNFPVESLKQKYLKIYLRTINAWEKEEDDQILLCAYESDIKVDNPQAMPILRQGSKKKNNRLKEIQGLLAYQWYHIPERNKSKTLEDYLKKLGYDFTLEEVEKVVHLARKRKVGTRPKNFRKLKNVK
tara:strand:- start:580 stop:1302 length:723 start_codon:yes stop_codon:yes gene_type:complete